ncbi:MAG: hypothetical protein ACK5UT_14215 [Acidobacteriota bacterium]
MKRLLLSVCIVAAMAVAQSKPEPTAGQKPARKPPAGVPANATMVDEITWRAVDAQGKPWMYKVTPFGLMKSAELTVTEQQKRDGVSDPLEGMSVKEEGGLLKFSRTGPFGVSNWTKKKTDLDAEEKAVWERSQAARKTTAGTKE